MLKQILNMHKKKILPFESTSVGEEVPKKGTSILGDVQKLCEQGPKQAGLALELPCCKQGIGLETSRNPFLPDFLCRSVFLCC